MNGQKIPLPADAAQIAEILRRACAGWLTVLVTATTLGCGDAEVTPSVDRSLQPPPAEESVPRQNFVRTVSRTRIAETPGSAPAKSDASGSRSAKGSTESKASTVPLFEQVAQATGLTFRHQSGRSPNYYFPEAVGSGVALLDFDNDGDLDVYLVQGHQWQTDGDGNVRPGEPAMCDRLYRNDLSTDGHSSTLKFVDVTESSGLTGTDYGMGVAAADFNDDGYVDLYVTAFGQNRLWLNNGDQTFSDASEQWQANDDRWSTSAAAVDFDRDGRLDLFVCNYVNFTFASHKECFDSTTVRDYCGPLSYPPVPDRLLRNTGHGFEDVSATAGIAAASAAGLGIAAADLNGDGWPDLFVANDGMPNHCWINQRDGTFVETALLAGCAYNQTGAAEAGMGTDAADIDDDGDDDLFLAHLTGETNTVYLNTNGVFDDATNRLGLGAPGIPATSFGAGWVDFDNDSRLDVFTVSGAVKRGGSSRNLQQTYLPGQSNQLYRQHDDGRFVEVSEEMPPEYREQLVSRGAAIGDLDNDGDSDLIVTNHHGPVQVFLNQSTQQRNWIGLSLLGGTPARHQLGAVATVRLPDSRTLRRVARTDGSYCSSRDPRILFGIDRHEDVSAVRVQWPDGTVEQFTPVLNQYSSLQQGFGQQP